MTDRELLDLFAAWRDDIDSVPYAHDSEQPVVAAMVPVTPAGGAGCPVVLGAAAVVLLTVVVVVAQLVMAVR